MIAAVVLAAGGGTRSDGPRALLRVDDQPLVCRAVAAACEAGCAPVVVVLGCEVARVRAEAGLPEGVVVVEDAGWRAGSGSGLRAGLAALSDTDVDAAVVLQVELAGVGAAAVQRITQGVDAAALRTATYEGRRGYPVVLGRDHWAGAATLAIGDVGARAYLTARGGQVATIACEDVADGTVVQASVDAK